MTIAERVYETLRSDIFEFRLMPGEKFSEGDIASRLGVSRTPVRESLYRLQRDGYVDVIFRSGWQVRPFDFNYFEDLYDLRITLEQSAVFKLCQADTQPPELEELKHLWNPANIGNASDVQGLDEAFHGQIVAAAGNQEMTRVHHSVAERLRIIRRLDFTLSDRIEATYREHYAILEALIRREAAHAARQLTEHIRESQAVVKSITLERIQQVARTSRQSEM